jgi:PRC-barrel domain
MEQKQPGGVGSGRADAPKDQSKETVQMDHTTHTKLVDSELTEANLLDAVVYGADDTRIGTVSHVHGMGAATHVIVDVGGFLGIGAKPVSLTTDQLNFMRDADGTVHATTSWTKEQIKALPEHMH